MANNTIDNIMKEPIYKDISKALQYGLQDNSFYSNPAYVVSNPVKAIDEHTKDQKPIDQQFISNQEAFLNELNTFRSSIDANNSNKSEFPVVNYSELGPLQELRLMSAGDTANYFLNSISGATMGDGTGPLPPGYAEGCPAGDSKFNVFANPKYNKFFQ